jgi:hypothetical protein
MTLRLEGKTPFTVHILRVRIRRGKDALDLYPAINFPGETRKLRTMHFPAHILSQTPPQPRFLGRT